MEEEKEPGRRIGTAPQNGLPEEPETPEAAPSRPEDGIFRLTQPISPDPQTSVTVPLDHLEAALERVVRKVFQRKVEKMLLDIIDRAVSLEMDRIKSLILSPEGGENQNPGSGPHC